MARLSLLFSILIAALLPAGACADVRIPGFYTDHMVLQQQKPIRLRGWAEPGEKVTVTLGENAVTATANDKGHWKAELPPMEAGSTPHVLKFSAANTIELKDVLIGEVWLCSGQSNMEWTVAASLNAQAEIQAADFPMIRHMKVAHRPSTTPLDDVPSQWQVCSPETAGQFTACGYFMARRLHKELGVPIGLINSSWGGTRVEPWTPVSGFAAVETLSEIHTSVLGRTPGSDLYRSRLSEHIAATEDWLTAARASLENAEPLGPAPAYPQSLLPFTSHQDPTMLYNGMLHAIVGFPIRGAIWYQGESNHTEGMLYTEKKKALIGGWRELWQQGDFPFYFVQIAPFTYGNEDPAVLAEFWEAQQAVTELPRTEMVVINDVATLNDIHPPNKQDVGRRLADLALRYDYDRSEITARSPVMTSFKETDGAIVVCFENTAGGLRTRDGKPATHFEVIGPDSEGWQPADAHIDGDCVRLTSPKTQNPTAFRFAWHKLAEPNLTGGSGLPVGAFRAGEVPDFASTIPGLSEYRLVYDLDLRKLGGTISYQVDESRNAGSFTQVGYLVQLNTGTNESQEVFVSMPAFTDDATLLGIPTAQSGARFQQPVENVRVLSSTEAVPAGDALRGNLEFWPNNYATANSANVPGASGSAYDFGDQPAEPVNGYGCMQVHLTEARTTAFAVNHWSAGTGADVGIGNSSGETKDWTFKGNAGDLKSGRLRVYVR